MPELTQYLSEKIKEKLDEAMERLSENCTQNIRKLSGDQFDINCRKTKTGFTIEAYGPEAVEYERKYKVFKQTADNIEKFIK